jgi:hypothetical protein
MEADAQVPEKRPGVIRTSGVHAAGTDARECLCLNMAVALCDSAHWSIKILDWVREIEGAIAQEAIDLLSILNSLRMILQTGSLSDFHLPAAPHLPAAKGRQVSHRAGINWPAIALASPLQYHDGAIVLCFQIVRESHNA